MGSTNDNEGPVLTFVNKRIRGLRKKLNRINQIEDSIAQGKPINKEQEDLIRSKTSIAASIDELERLREPLSVAVVDERKSAVMRFKLADSDEVDTSVDESRMLDDKDRMMEDLIKLIYFGVMFDVKSQNDFRSMMFTQMHERGSCLTYDYVTDDESADPLSEKDLDDISHLTSLLISRHKNSTLSHNMSLQYCVYRAKQWLSNSDEPIDSDPSITYASLRTKLNKIMASDYATTLAEMKPTAEMAANYGSFQVSVPVQVKTLDEDGVVPNVQGNGTHIDELGSMEGSQKEESELKDLTSFPQTEVVKGQNDGEVESKVEQQHQYGNRRGQYQNQRGGRVGNGGGRRGGYLSGRVGRGNGGGRGGGGSYQNGRNQFYDQPAGNNNNNYPRNHYNNNNRQRGGGGRGGAAYNNVNNGAGNHGRYEQEAA